MDNRIIASAVVAVATIASVILAGRYVDQASRTRAVEVCYATSTLPYTSKDGEGMFFDKEKYKACMNEMGY